MYLFKFFSLTNFHFFLNFIFIQFSFFVIIKFMKDCMIRSIIENYYYQKTLLQKIIVIEIVRETIYINPFIMDITIEIIITIFIIT